MFIASYFIVTVISEYAVVAFFERRRFLSLACILLGIHLVTHTTGVWLFRSGTLSYAFTEALIASTEAILYALLLKISPLRAIVMSLAANAFSIAVGVLIWGI